MASRLAKFFPEATPVRIPIKLSRIHGNSTGNGNRTVDENECILLQETVIEYSTPHEVLFVLGRPLEFSDRVLLESNDGLLHAEASVVAVQYHPDQTVIAARFLKPVSNWIVKS